MKIYFQIATAQVGLPNPAVDLAIHREPFRSDLKIGQRLPKFAIKFSEPLNVQTSEVWFSCLEVKFFHEDY